MAFSLKKVVMDEIKKKRIRSIVDKNTLWPSQAAVRTRTGEVIGKCLRASYYEKTGETETNPVSDEVCAMGYMGKEIETGLIEIVKNQGIWENNNVKWQRYNISGEIDVLIRTLNRENGGVPVEEVYIVECKTCSGYFANKELYGYNEGAGNNKVWIKGKPKSKHYLQAALYAYAGREKVKGTILFYISRDESRMMEFLIRVDNDGNIFVDEELETRFNINDVLERYEVLQKAIDLKELPDRDYNPEYTDAQVEHFYEIKKISKTARDNHINRKTLYADSDCNYCNFKLKCMGQAVTVQASIKEEIEFEIPKVTMAEKPDYIQFGSY